MDYLRRQQLLAEADSLKPGLGGELARFPIASSADLDQLQAMIDEHKQFMATHATLSSEYQRQRDEYRRLAAASDAKIAASGLGSLAPAALAAARQLGAASSWLGLNTASEGAMAAAWVAKDAEELRQERVQVWREAHAPSSIPCPRAITEVAEITAALRSPAALP
ncbi:hypothetical protein GPECTOR_16g727 [Gonium pectorale]|uniref:Uncharacterized protein n=1 Tax=Gonium pectorale TaxID=33097 RepID=A0A150GL67_GONPE|nr:hypothetical protein GPECTOR_16g727 [Gonium pectorale]|eukprot:KXZ50552.1 hypothetical protein GPECTOR_16g727 [Gonium pectorale]